MKQVITDVADEPATALESLRIGKQGKAALRVDVNAEDTFRRELHKYHDRRFKKVEVYGEESLRDAHLDLSHSKGLVALVDAVDGTDLVERGLFNWCSAAVFFDPREPEGGRLIASIVGLPSGEIYFASAESSEVCVLQDSRQRQVAGPSRVKSCRRASVCFYGQKAENFVSIATGRFTKAVEGLARTKANKPDLRLYNFAGIPMMVKLIDHQVPHARGIDAVLDVKGQKPHDFVPGAFIAKKAGATVKDLSGKEISFSELERSLLKPASTVFRYVVASTEQLCDQLLQMV